MKIVIAEDGPEHARILQAVLKRTGCELLFVEDGNAAYAYLSKNEMPDLLITDIMMPGMSGFELMARLKAEGKLPPTLILTSKQREEDQIRGLELGAIDYITKPFSPTVILAKVKNALGRKAA